MQADLGLAIGDTLAERTFIIKAREKLECLGESRALAAGMYTYEFYAACSTNNDDVPGGPGVITGVPRCRSCTTRRRIASWRQSRRS